MEHWKQDRIASAERGENPTVMVKMKSGYAVIGDNQFLPGYCVFLGYPQAGSLNELSLAQRTHYLLDMTGNLTNINADPAISTLKRKDIPKNLSMNKINTVN